MVDVKTVLFPTDFSDFSNKAFPYAASLANAFNARIVLMHVEELEEEDPANPKHSFAALESHAGPIETERVVIRGHAPYKDILEVSRAKNCDLIVMATHGRSSLSQFFLGGSIAEEVARFSTIPVFIAKIEVDQPPETYTGRLKEILFTTDLSKGSLSALRYARGFADKFSAKLFILHVIDDDCETFYAGQGLKREDPDFADKVNTLLKTVVGADAGFDAVFHVSEGRAESEIVKFADANKIDLIAMSTHGHAGLREEVIGTTSARVIRHAPCPVLTVRG
jgi:nucleotide-binding universal stress UspA family protein